MTLLSAHYGACRIEEKGKAGVMEEKGYEGEACVLNIK